MVSEEYRKFRDNNVTRNLSRVAIMAAAAYIIGIAYHCPCIPLGRCHTAHLYVALAVIVGVMVMHNGYYVDNTSVIKGATGAKSSGGFQPWTFQLGVNTDNRGNLIK